MSKLNNGLRWSLLRRTTCSLIDSVGMEKCGIKEYLKGDVHGLASYSLGDLES